MEPLPSHEVTLGAVGPRAATVRLVTLGRLEVHVGGEAIHPGALRLRRILTILAVAASEHRVVGADELIEAVYGEDPPPRVRRSLSTELWRCRQLIGADAIRGEDDGYRLDTQVVDVDLVRFVRELEEGRAALAAGDLGAAERLLSGALHRWRGAPLADWSDHPDGQATIARLEELRLGGTEDLGEALAGTGRHAEALATLVPVTQAHPAREHAWALVIECHLALGDRRRARTALDSARRTLAEHGVDIGAELRAVRDLLHTASPDRPAPRAVATGPGPAFVGRDQELATAVGVVARALTTSQPAALLVTGEAGVGKSALVERAAAAAAGESGDPLVGVVQCDRRLTLPYAALAPLLHRLGPHTADPAGVQEAVRAGGRGHARSEELREGLVELIEDATAVLGGLVLVVEDVHWATAELVDLLVSLLARHTPLPLALVVTQREPARVAPELQALLAELRRRAELLHLEGIEAAHTRQLLGPAGDPDVADAAHRLTGGNPLYLRHLTLEADGSLVPSASVAEALDEHIDSLPVEALAVLEVAALIGTRFDSRVLASTVAHPPLRIGPDVVEAALDTARAARLVTTAGPPHHLAFVHTLLRDRLYDRTPAPQRTTAHALVVRALTRLGTVEDTSPDLVAYHARKGWPACPTAEAIAHLVSAGESAVQQLGFAEAARHFRMALDLTAMDPDHDDDAQLAHLLTLSGQAALAAEDLPAARTAYRALLDHAGRIGSPLTAVGGATGLVRTYSAVRVEAPALDALTAALEDLLDVEPTGTAEERGLAAEALGVLHSYRPEAARRLRDRAAARDPEGRSALLVALWDREPVPEALAIARELAASPDAEPLGAALRLWASEVAAGQRSLAEEPPGVWALEGTEEARWDARTWQVTVAMGRGELDRALRLLDEADELVGRVPTAAVTATRRATLLGQRMWVAYQREDGTELMRLARLNRPVYSTRRPIMRSASAIFDILVGDHDQAARHVDGLVEAFLSGDVPGRQLHVSVAGFANSCLWLGNERGVRLARELFAGSEGEHVLFYPQQYWGSVHLQQGKLSAWLGDLDEAVHHLEHAVAEHRAVAAPLIEAQARRRLAASLWHRNRGADRSEADEHRAAATAAADRLGVPALAQRPWPPATPFDSVR